MDAIRNDSYSVLNKNIIPKNKNSLPENKFGDFLKSSINEVNNMQKEARIATQNLASGKEKDIHNTMIALQKASVSFELLVQVQNKLMAAYDELKRMQI